MAASLSVLPKIEVLSPLVTRILGCNPGPYTLQGTNSYLIGNTNRRLLLDTSNPGVTDYVTTLRDYLAKVSVQLSGILITHHHIDHVGAAPEVIDALQQGPIPVHKLARRCGAEKDIGRQYSFVTDRQRFEVPGATLEAVYLPGHSDDHLCFVLQEEAALFSGDNVLGEGTTVFEDLFDYMHSLKRMLSLPCARIYPGHGPVVEDGRSAIQTYIKHRQLREQQILQQLATEARRTSADKSSSSGISASTIVESIYPGLPPQVLLGAVNNVRLHLRKLQKESVVGQLLERSEASSAVLGSS